MASPKATLFLNQTFSSFEEFEKAKCKYEEEKFMLWKIGKSTTVAYSNKLITSKGGTDVFDEKLKYRYARFSCKLGVLDGEDERIGTGKGARPIQETNKIGCEALLHLKAKGRNQLFVFNLIEEHNHECTKELYENFPEIRQLIPEDVQQKIQLLSDAKVRPCRIRIVLRGLTGNLTSRDLSNFRARLEKEKHEGRSAEERLSKTLEDLVESDKDASVVIGRDETENMKYLFFQTSGMKRNVARYGRVLMLDHSHKVNRNRMPVCVIMVMDGEGNGRAAGYAFVADEHLVTVAEVLSAFRDSIGEESAIVVRTIIIDKDPSEIGAIELVFPEVHIHLCIFHVGRTLNEKSAKESALVKDILDKLKYCRTDSQFQSLCTELKEAATPKFYLYFDGSWKQCPQAWSYRDKQKSINLGNTTTNRVENHNSKIKMILNSNSTLADAVEGLLNLFVNKEEDVYFRETNLKVTYKTTSMNDPIVKAMLNDLTKFCAKILIHELDNVPSDEEIEEFEGSSDNCLCPHHWSYELPCRHIFQCRRMDGQNPYKIEEIDSMWKKRKAGDDVPPVPPGLLKVTKIQSKSAKTPRERFRAADDTCKLIAALLAECGSAQFEQRHVLLKELLKLWASGKELVLLEKPEGTNQASLSLSSCVVQVLQVQEIPNSNEENAIDGTTSPNQSESEARTVTTEENLIEDSTDSESEANIRNYNDKVTGNNEIPVIVIDTDDENYDTPISVKVEISDAISSFVAADDISLENDELTKTIISTDANANKLPDVANMSLHETLDHADENGSSLTRTRTPQLYESFSFDDAEADELLDLDELSVEPRDARDDQDHGNSLIDSTDLPPVKDPQDKNISCVDANADKLVDLDKLSAKSMDARDDQGNENSPTASTHLTPVKDPQDNSISRVDAGADQLAGLVSAIDELSDEENRATFTSLLDDDNDFDFSQVAKSVELSDLCLTTPQKNHKPPEDENPLCFCKPRKPTRRYIAGPTAKPSFVGRPYFACARRLCKYFTPAKRDPVPNSDVRKAMDGIKLPVCKPRGRPKGSKKTVMIKFKDNQSCEKPPKPKGAFSTPFEVAAKGRKARGSKIKDTDLEKISENEWKCSSQSNKNLSYTVTRDSCSCPDWTTNGSVCKHMFKVRSMGSESSVVVTHALIQNTGACCICQQGEPDHHCDKCSKPVHATDLCSIPLKDGEEGYGKPRRCLSCKAKFSANLNVRKRGRNNLANINLDEIQECPSQKKTNTGTLSSQSQPASQSSYGRKITPKIRYTPSKPNKPKQ